MNDFINKWLFDPTIGKIVTALLGIIIVVTIVRILQRTVSSRITQTETRYRTRKYISLFGYVLGIIVLATVFSDKLGGFTVALGVTGAGILVSWPLTRRRHTGHNRQYIGLLAFVHMIHRDGPSESPHRGDFDGAFPVKKQPR